MNQTLVAEIDKAYPGGARIQASFEVPADRSHVSILFGPSGVGKTTVLRCLAGLEGLTSGRIVFRGDVWTDAAVGRTLPPQKRPLGYLPQDYALFPHLTVRRNVGYSLRSLPARQRQTRIEQLLRSMKLEGVGDSFPARLSGGQRQRVALARALAREPKLLLLDEPLSSLDHSTRAHVQSELGRILRRLGIPVVVVTHDWTEALALGDELAVLGSNGILQQGPPQEVFSRPAHVEVAAAVGVETIVPCRELERKDGLIILKAADHEISAIDSNGTESEFYACLRGEDVTLEKGSAIQSSARNHLPGRILEVAPAGPMRKVVVDVGFAVASLVTRQALEDLQAREGETVAVVFKAAAVHLIPRR